MGWFEALGFFCLLGLATLAKGPIGALLPGLVIGVFLCVKRDLPFVRHLHLVTGGLLFLLIAGSWYALAVWYGGEAFFREADHERERAALCVERVGRCWARPSLLLFHP